MDLLLPEVGWEEPPSSSIPPVDKDNCSLLGPTGLLVQAIMALLVLGTLVVKRYRENPRRPWPVWLADVGKQVIGQGFLHSTNVIFSTLFSHADQGNACTAYFLSIFVDCTLGVLIIYSTLRIFSHILVHRMHLKGYRSGQYYEKKRSATAEGNQTAHPEGNNDLIFEAEGGDQRRQSIDSLEDGHKPASAISADSDGEKRQFQFSWWGKQLLVYLVSLTIMKLGIIGFFFIPAVLSVGDWLLSWLGEDTKLVFVLMIFPLAMNLLQFLLIDAILKSKTPFSEAGPTAQTSAGSSRRTSLDRNSHHGGEDDEGRGLLHDTTHDDIESGLPSYEVDTHTSTQDTHAAFSQTSQDGAKHDFHEHEHEQTAASPTLSEEEDTSSTPRPTNNGFQRQHYPHEKQNAGSIPMKLVPVHTRQLSDHSIRSEKSDSREETEVNGWDWLSDDGTSSSSHQHEWDDYNKTPNAQSISTFVALPKVTKVA